MVSLREISFGKASAEAERKEYPELLLDGFFDHAGVVDRCKNGNEFLILGKKGCGKSSIAEHLRLSAPRDKLFVNLIPLNDFLFEALSSPSNTEFRLPTTWSWLLYYVLLGSILRDDGATGTNDRPFLDALAVFKDSGLALPGQRVTKTQLAERSVRVGYAQLGAGATWVSQTTDIQRRELVSTMIRALQATKSDSKHFVVIDGVDDVLEMPVVDLHAISALLTEVARMQDAPEIPGKVLLLCRPDLYERLPNPNKNHYRQDSSIVLDWYSRPGEAPSDAPLVELVNTRLARYSTTWDDLVSTELPAGPYGRDSLSEFLLRYTRFRPRDFVVLLRHLTELSTGERLTRDQLRQALFDYSSEYFVPELRDELTGYHKTDDITALFDVFASRRTPKFTPAEIHRLMPNQGDGIDTLSMLRTLFACGAIGGVETGVGSYPDKFIFAGPTVGVVEQTQLILHVAFSSGLGVTPISL